MLKWLFNKLFGKSEPLTKEYVLKPGYYVRIGDESIDDMIKCYGDSDPLEDIDLAVSDVACALVTEDGSWDDFDVYDEKLNLVWAHTRYPIPEPTPKEGYYVRIGDESLDNLIDHAPDDAPFATLNEAIGNGVCSLLKGNGISDDFEVYDHNLNKVYSSNE